MARHNQKVKLKRSDLEVTRLSLGTAPLGGLFKSVTDADGDELLNTALDVGINYFDTAPQYGHGVAEIRLGKALRGAKVPSCPQALKQPNRPAIQTGRAISRLTISPQNPTHESAIHCPPPWDVVLR